MKAIRAILASIRKADKEFSLINKGDKILIGLSGGKDSLVLTYALSLYKKFSKCDFTIRPVILDLGFGDFSPNKLKDFCASLGLDLIVNDSTFVYKAMLDHQVEGHHIPCSICSRMKKAAMNSIAKELSFNKVAFAHHRDDAIETLFMNEIYGGRMATFSPKMHLERSGIDFIRPLILASEKDIIKCAKEENLPILSSTCPADGHTSRQDVKDLLNKIYIDFPIARENLSGMLTNFEKMDLWDKEIFYQIEGSDLSLKPVLSKVDTLHMVSIRSEVFIKEQNCPIEDEFDGSDETATNYLIYLKSTPIGTIRYIKTGFNEFQIGRFAVLSKFRHLGYGDKAFTSLINMLISQYDPCTIWFNGQSYLKNYYLSKGFELVGEEFSEVNIPHCKFIKHFSK